MVKLFQEIGTRFAAIKEEEETDNSQIIWFCFTKFNTYLKDSFI